MKYQWDDFSLDLEAMLLIRDGRQVDVTRKTLACIHYRVENRHRVVGYDELIRTLWGNDNITNHQLSQIILPARRAIGDDGQAQRLIRTAPGLGYRWVGPINECAHQPQQRTKQSEEASLPAPPPPTGPIIAETISILMQEPPTSALHATDTSQSDETSIKDPHQSTRRK